MDGNGRWAAAGAAAAARPSGRHAAVREVGGGLPARPASRCSRSSRSARRTGSGRPSEIDGADEAARGVHRARGATSCARSGSAVRDPRRARPPGAERRARRSSGSMAQTAGGDALALNLCISYSSRAEIARAARLLAEEVAAGRLDAGRRSTRTRFAQRLYTAAWPDPDLLIRTSGEMRISNFLLWQLAYAELYVTPVLWPDFTRRHSSRRSSISSGAIAASAAFRSDGRQHRSARVGVRRRRDSARARHRVVRRTGRCALLVAVVGALGARELLRLRATAGRFAPPRRIAVSTAAVVRAARLPACSAARACAISPPGGPTPPPCGSCRADVGARAPRAR